MGAQEEEEADVERRMDRRRTPLRPLPLSPLPLMAVSVEASPCDCDRPGGVGRAWLPVMLLLRGAGPLSDGDEDAEAATGGALARRRRWEDGSEKVTDFWSLFAGWSDGDGSSPGLFICVMMGYVYVGYCYFL